jgi:hypothetical protein
VEETEYLGKIAGANGNNDTENRVQKANQFDYQINQTRAGKKKISNTKCELIKRFHLSTVLYGSRWTMLTKHENRITSAYMTYLRKCTGKTRRDRI